MQKLQELITGCLFLLVKTKAPAIMASAPTVNPKINNSRWLVKIFGAGFKPIVKVIGLPISLALPFSRI